MSPQLSAGDILNIDGTEYVVAMHPERKDEPYAQMGRRGVVYNVSSSGADAMALKMFSPRYRVPPLVMHTGKLAKLCDLPAISAANRKVLTPQRYTTLLRQQPDLSYAILMPWIEGPSWAQLVQGQQALTSSESLSLASPLAQALSIMEQGGYAHCALAGSCLLLPGLTGRSKSAIEFVGLEQFYGPSFPKLLEFLSPTPGYNARSNPDSDLLSNADRFAGGILIAEMLTWCDDTVRSSRWGSSYFDPEEMQKPCQRLDILLGALRQYWGDSLAELFRRLWNSENSADCPSFGEWVIFIPGTATPPVEKNEASEPLKKLAKNNKCANCGEPLASEVRFCDRCGFKVGDIVSTSLPVTVRMPDEVPVLWIKCPKCGHQNPPGSTFCEMDRAELPGPTNDKKWEEQDISPPTAVIGSETAFYVIPRFVHSSGFVINFKPGKTSWDVGREDPVYDIHPDIDLTAFENGSTVSRQHAQIRVNGKDIVLISVTPTNWTRVNSVRLLPHTPVVLKPGDRIEFAKVVVTFNT